MFDLKYHALCLLTVEPMVKFYWKDKKSRQNNFCLMQFLYPQSLFTYVVILNVLLQEKQYMKVLKKLSLASYLCWCLSHIICCRLKTDPSVKHEHTDT